MHGGYTFLGLYPISFRRKLKKQRGLTAPVLFQPPAESKTNIAEREEVVTDTSVKKPVKLKKTVKLPGEEDDEIRDKQQKRKLGVWSSFPHMFKILNRIISNACILKMQQKCSHIKVGNIEKPEKKKKKKIKKNKKK